MIGSNCAICGCLLRGQSYYLTTCSKECARTASIQISLDSYVRPLEYLLVTHPFGRIIQAVDSKGLEPLCRICWEKATEQCQEHNRIPDPNEVRGCYGPLFTCPSCKRRVCAGYGGAPDPRCDTCVSEPADD